MSRGFILFVSTWKFFCVTLQRTSYCHHSAWHRVCSNPAGCINERYFLVTLLDMATNAFVTPVILVLCLWLCLFLTSGVDTPTWCCFFRPNTTNPSTTIRWPSFIYSCAFEWHLCRPQLPSSRSCPHGWYFWNLNFILAINQLDAQNLFYSKFISCIYMFRAPCAHRQEVKIIFYSLWYHHTETSEWSKITKIIKMTKIYKYEHIVINLFVWIFRVWLLYVTYYKIHTHTHKITTMCS
jgi:hypothetical protein